MIHFKAGSTWTQSDLQWGGAESFLSKDQNLTQQINSAFL